MIDQHTDFFKCVDNFAKTTHIPSIPIFEAKSDYIPEITIAIPTYKRAHLLKEAVDSAINQIDYTNYDIIVVDNNPERGCETEKLMMLYSNNPIISYYKNADNLDMAGNWNRLFTLAKGKYVVMLHDDDLLLPSFLSECVALAERLNADLIKPLAFNVNKGDRYNNLSDKRKLYRIKRVFDISNYYGFALGAPTGCYMKKECIIKLGGFNPDFYPTMDFCFLSLFSKHYKSYKIFKRLYIYRILENTTFQKEVMDKCIYNDFFLISKILENYFVNKRLTKVLLSYKIHNNIKGYAKYWDMPNYNFDLKQLGLNPSDKNKGYLIKYPIRFYVLLWEFLLKLKKQ